MDVRFLWSMLSMTNSSTLQLRVAAIDRPHPLLCRLVLRAFDGASLPPYDPGAHLQVAVHLPDGKVDWRHYSLVNFDVSEAARSRPDHYLLGVRLEPAGRGGSRFMHGLVVGDTVTARSPRNDFPLGDGNAPALVVAGGIGVTPLVSMVTECRRRGRPVRMLYASRSRDQMLFVDELRLLLGDDLSLHADEEAARPVDVASVLDTCSPDEVLYVCGPQPLLDALLGEARQRGWPPERIRFELFSAPQMQLGDQPFDVVLVGSRQTLRVGVDQSILECLEAAGCDVLADCRRGECGVCVVPVLDGDVDHRDHVLSTAERDAGKLIQICVSRAKGPRLVLDL